MTRPQFRITITFQDTFDVDALWPDGDGPDNPTVEDVREMLDTLGGGHWLSDELNMDDPTVDVEQVT